MPLSAVLIPSFTSVVLPFNKVPLSGPHSPCLGLTRTVVLEKTLESPLDSKEIQPVNPKGHQSWVFIGRTGVEAETPIVWPHDVKSWLIGKDPDAGKDGRQEEKGMTEDEMVGWHHRFNGNEFGWTQGVGDGQGSLVHCSSWSCKELDMTEWLNWTRSWGRGRWIATVSVWDDEKVLETDISDGWTTLGMYLMPLNCTL